MCHNIYHIHLNILDNQELFLDTFQLHTKFGDGEMIHGVSGYVCGHMQKFLMKDRGMLLAAVCSHCAALDQLKHLC